MARTKEEKCTEKCTCYQYQDDDDWVRKSLERLAGILELGENYKLMGGDKNDQNWSTECPLCHKGKKPGMDEQYAFEQAVLKERSRMERSGFRAVPAPCLYKRGSDPNCKRCRNGWCVCWCPDLILFSEKEKKLWVVEVMTMHESVSEGNRRWRKWERRKKIKEKAEKFFGFIPKGWNSWLVLVELKGGIHDVKGIEQDLDLSPSDSIVDLITKGEDIYIRGRKKLGVVLRKS